MAISETKKHQTAKMMAGSPIPLPRLDSWWSSSQWWVQTGGLCLGASPAAGFVPCLCSGLPGMAFATLSEASANSGKRCTMTNAVQSLRTFSGMSYEMRRKVWLDSFHPFSSLPKPVLGLGREVNGENLWLISHLHMLSFLSWRHIKSQKSRHLRMPDTAVQKPAHLGAGVRR